MLYVIPDIIVSEEHGEYTAALNEDVYRKLRLNESYVKLKDSEESEVREYIIQKTGAGKVAEKHVLNREVIHC